MPKISIIVPVYNAEQFLSRCVDSILAQSFSDFELILVNDGSQDESLEICNHYSGLDARVIVVSQDNGGVSSARNHGIEVSTGDYICFVDADDYVNSSYLEQLVSPAHEDGRIDLVLQGRVKCEKNIQTIISPSLDEVFFLSENSKFFDNVNLFRFCAVFSKLFKRRIVKDHEISFPESMNHGEDFDFFAKYLLYCEVVYVSTCANYYYIINDGSLSDRFNAFQQKHIDLNYLYNSLSCLCQKYGEPSSLKKQIEEYVGSSVARLLSLVYEPPRANKSVRINKMKSIEDCFVKSYHMHFIAPTFKSKILKFLFVNKYYGLYDLLNLLYPIVGRIHTFQ